MCQFNNINKMNTQIKNQELEAKRTLLNNAVIQLKKEFVGLDDVIDQIANTITAWLYFPELQEKPVIVNLWGLTGIGKTSLIRRLSELLDFSNKYYHFDTNSYGYRNRDFEDIYKNCKGASFIVTLDEFQLARTIDEDRKERDNNSLKNIWDILDSGKFEYTYFDNDLQWLFYLIERLSRTIIAGVKVENGKVTGDYKKFLEYKKATRSEARELSWRDESDSKSLDEVDKNDKDYKKLLKDKPFINNEEVEKIFNMEHIDLDMTIKELRENFYTLNANQTINFLKKIYNSGLKPKVVDCTKALIFVIGNLDEVYTMARDFTTDLSADAFHLMSTKITLPDVKNALLKRFRSEQIARLGNNHIIYPAFRKKDFYDIIDIELNKIKAKIQKMYNIDVIFNNNIPKLIYKEGVFPTQGCRPVFSTVYEIINARLGKIMIDVFNCKTKIDTLEFKITDNDFVNLSESVNMEIDFIKNKKIISTHKEEIKLKLAKLVVPKSDDKQSIIAVHEAGHCVLEIALLKKIPEQVVSVSASEGGFTSSKNEYNYVTKKIAKNKLAIFFGGFVAEEMIFGEDNVSVGSMQDIECATECATEMLTKQGFGMHPIDPAALPQFDNRLISKDEIIKIINDAKTKAKIVLENQKKLLLHIADYLSDNQSIDRDGLIEMTKKYANNLNIDEIIADKNNLYYRNHLKALVKEVC